jgi:hypothetical protein
VHLWCAPPWNNTKRRLAPNCFFPGSLVFAQHLHSFNDSSNSGSVLLGCVVSQAKLGVLRGNMVEVWVQAGVIQRHRCAQPGGSGRVVGNLLPGQRMDQDRVGSTVQDEPRVAPSKVLASTPDLVAADGVGSTGGSVDSVLEWHHLEEPFLDKLQDAVTELDSRGLGGLVVLEPVEMEVEFLDLVVVVGLNTGARGSLRGGHELHLCGGKGDVDGMRKECAEGSGQERRKE